MQDPRYASYPAPGPLPASVSSPASNASTTASHQSMEPSSAALQRLMRRRVPPEKRQRTEMSCDWCKKKRCKCLRGSTVDTCRACSEIGRACTTTEPRKRRVYGSLSSISVVTTEVASQRRQSSHQTVSSDAGRSSSSTSAAAAAAATVAPSLTDRFSASAHPRSSMPAIGHHVQQPFSPQDSSRMDMDGVDDMTLDISTTDPRLLMRTHPSSYEQLTVSPREITTYHGNTSETTSITAASSTSTVLTIHKKANPQDKRICDERLFEDALGFPRYIGPLGSYTLLVKLWEVMAVWCAPPMAQISHRASAQTMGHSQPARPRFGSTGSIDDGTIIDGADHAIQQLVGGRNIDLPPREVADVLVGLFFDKVHCDFPLFHRALFQASYENMWASPSSTPSPSPSSRQQQQQHASYQNAGPEAEPAWLMCLSMVFVLGLEAASAQSSAIRRLVGNTARREALKARYLTKVQEVLPDVIAGSMLIHVQALMLYCRYLHITRSRNACWNLTGAAIRVAVAIGLHRNGVHGKCSPLERELRRRIWWTLYAFERIECSSLGRTSAIDDAECNVGVPTEGLLDMSDILPLGYVGAHAELMTMLGSICKHQYGGSNGGSGGAAKEGDGNTTPSGVDVPREQVEFATATVKSLDSWYSQLPAHLCLGANTPKSHQRAILLLHIQHHYTVTLLCRPFLLALVAKKKPASSKRRNEKTAGASSARQETSSSDQPVTDAADPSNASSSSSSTSSPLILYARKCIEAAKAAVAVIDRLFRAGLFNSKTWWDVYFIEATCMVLAMGRFVHDRDLRNDVGILDALRTCIHILKECKEFSPTMQRFAVVTTDFAQALVSDDSPRVEQDEQFHPKEAQQQPEPHAPTPQRKYQQQQQRQQQQQQQQHQQHQQQQHQQQQQQQQQQQFAHQNQGHYIHEQQPHNPVHSQQQHPFMYPGNRNPTMHAMYQVQELDELAGDIGSSSTAASQSGSSPDDSVIPTFSGQISGGAHDAVGGSVGGGGTAQDPFTMPWNLADISQFWGDWAEPDHWWQG